MVNEQRIHLLIQARLRQGWTQADLAEHLAVATKTVARWEAGTTIPQPVYRAKLKTLLQIDPEAIWPLHVNHSVQPDSADQAGVPRPQETQQPLTLSVVWNIPFVRNPFFTGREDFWCSFTSVSKQGKLWLSLNPRRLAGWVASVRLSWLWNMPRPIYSSFRKLLQAIR